MNCYLYQMTLIDSFVFNGLISVRSNSTSSIRSLRLLNFLELESLTMSIFLTLIGIMFSCLCQSSGIFCDQGWANSVKMEILGSESQSNSSLYAILHRPHWYCAFVVADLSSSPVRWWRSGRCRWLSSWRGSAWFRPCLCSSACWIFGSWSRCCPLFEGSVRCPYMSNPHSNAYLAYYQFKQKERIAAFAIPWNLGQCRWTSKLKSSFYGSSNSIDTIFWKKLDHSWRLSSQAS